MSVYVVEVLDGCGGEWRAHRAYEDQRAADLYAESLEDGSRYEAAIVCEVPLHVSEGVVRWEMEAP